MATAFQNDAFQNNAFQIGNATIAPNPIAIVWSVVTPTVSAPNSPQTVTPSPVIVVWSTVTPSVTIINFPQTVTSSPVIITWSTITPSVISILQSGVVGYPINVIVLDNSIVNAVMESEDVTLQTLYSLGIESGTLNLNSKLRIKVLLSRVVGTPLTDFVDCELCSETALAEPQTLTQVAALSPKTNLELFGGGSYSYIGDFNGNHEIYQATYFNDFPFVPGVPYDLNPNMKLWRIRGNTRTQKGKIITRTTTLLDSEGSFECGISDEPVYAMGSVVTFSSNAPEGIYLYFVDRNTQVFCPNVSGFYDYYSVSDNVIYLSQSTGVSPSLQIHKFNIGGIRLLSSSAIFNAGYSDIEAIHATGTSVYALVNGTTLLRLDKDSLTIRATWNLGHTNCRAIFVVSDNLVYFAHTATTPSISYIVLGTNTVVDIDNSITLTHSIPWALGPVFPIRNQLHFKKIGDNSGYFFLGGENHPVIIKIGPLNCD